MSIAGRIYLLLLAIILFAGGTALTFYFKHPAPILIGGYGSVVILWGVLGLEVGDIQ